MQSKYDALTQYLASHSGAWVRLHLAEIEALIRAPLPSGASTRRWWRNLSSQTQARSWLVAGWRVAAADFRTVPLTVTFVRDGASTEDNGSQ